MWENMKNVVGIMNLPWVIMKNVADLGYTGSRFIWANMCGSGNFVQQILGRIVKNLQWILKLYDDIVSHLPRTKFDHCLLFFSLSGDISEHANKPFRLETIWLDHTDFKNLIAQTWTSTMNNH